MNYVCVGYFSRITRNTNLFLFARDRLFLCASFHLFIKSLLFFLTEFNLTKFWISVSGTYKTGCLFNRTCVMFYAYYIIIAKCLKCRFYNNVYEVKQNINTLTVWITIFCVRHKNDTKIKVSRFECPRLYVIPFILLNYRWHS